MAVSVDVATTLTGKITDFTGDVLVCLMMVVHLTLTTMASFLGVEEMSRVLFDFTLPILEF